ncbi:MAG: beta-ketoacyl-ACP synthase II [Bacteriovoracaceae bacterium]|nr:beta-ketoacyl-ACP synthase II [Bacteriovoracaceae bacterium]
MATLQRVAITGMGAICGLGDNLQDVWHKATNGESGVSICETLDTEKLPIKIGGEVKNFELSEEILEAKEAARYDKFIHFALHAAHEALQDANLRDIENRAYPSERMGSILGVGMGGFPLIEKTHETFLNKGTRRVSPFFIPSIIPNMAPGLLTLRYGLKGVNYSISSACASAGHAIGAAVQEIMLGGQDVIVAGGAESVFSNLTFSGFANMKAMTKTFNENPTAASRPFDTDRNGFVIGEGAGILILENYDKARARGAKIYAEIVGHGSSSDAHHITAPHPEGAGAINCMKQALNMAEISPDAIGYVNAHGTSTPLGDIAETKAIRSVFEAHADELIVSSTKSMTGHLLGAAGGIETIFCAMALHTGIIPPTINLENQDPACDLNYCANKAQKRDLKYALNNSFGFGGTNSSTILKKED